MRTLVLLACLLASCAPPFDRAAFLAGFVGVPEAELVRRLGVPSRTYDADGRKFLAYAERRSTVYAGGPVFGGFGYFGPGYGYYGAFPSRVVERECETTFELAAGRVASWSLRGNAC